MFWWGSLQYLAKFKFTTLMTIYLSLNILNNEKIRKKKRWWVFMVLLFFMFLGSLCAHDTLHFKWTVHSLTEIMNSGLYTANILHSQFTPNTLVQVYPLTLHSLSTQNTHMTAMHSILTSYSIWDTYYIFYTHTFKPILWVYCLHLFDQIHSNC